MTKQEFDERVRMAAVSIVDPVLRTWQIQHAGQPDQFVGKLLGELLTQMVGLRIMFLEALDMNGFFTTPDPDDPDNPAPWEPPPVIN